MPGPTLTPQEIAQLQAEKAKQENFRDAMTAAVPQKQARAAELAVADGGFKKFFDYYNDDIIGKYDAERKALDGQYIASPITEADVEGPANVDGSVRTTPVTPVTDIIRVQQFDGGPLVSTDVNETKAIADQAIAENTLVNGYVSSGFTPATAKTGTALTAASTSLKVDDATNPLSIPIGATFVVKTISDLAVVKVTAITVPPNGAPPYTATYGIQLIVPPTGTIPTTTSLSNFTGFNNTERTNKIASDVQLQPLMNYLILQLQNQANARIARLNEQLVAIAANQDPDGVATLATATTNANASKTFLTNYLITTDISNTGLGTLSTERGTRGGQITTRIGVITAAYTGQSLNYYDARYTNANNRGNTARGSLRLQKATEQSVDQLDAFAAGAQASIDAIDALLNP